MLAQNRTLRRHALGQLPRPAARRHDATRRCCCFLSLANSRPGGAERELRPRADGAVHARPRLQRARHPPGLARAHRLPRRLARRRQRRAPTTTPSAHDTGRKRIFGKPGHFDWKDVLGLCVRHPAHAPFLVDKLWDFFVGAPLPLGRAPRAGARSTAAPATASSRWWREILAHPALYRKLDAPDMVKSPVVFVAGALRSSGPGHRPRRLGLAAERHGPVSRSSPPSVAGWDWGTAWLSSNSMHVRFDVANYLLDTPRVRVEDGSTPAGSPPRQARRPRPPRGGRPVDLAAHRRASCCAWPAACSPTASAATAAGASPSSSAPTCASACCASCCSPDPTPRCTDDAPPRLRRLPPHLRGRAPRLPRRRRAHPPPGARRRARRRPGALHGEGHAARARVRGRRGGRRGRAQRARCSCRCSCPAASTCSTRSCRCTTTAATPTCTPS